MHIMQVSNARKRHQRAAIGRDQMLAIIQTAWREKAFRQGEAAAELKIDQGQISKIVNGRFRRAAGNAAKLFEYANRRLADAQQEGDAETLRAALVKQLLATWDQTAPGAQSLMALLEAVRRLRGEGAPRH